MALYVQDTADVLLTRKSDGYQVFSATTQSIGIDQSVDEEEIKGGIGNSTQFTIKSNKSLEITVQDALFDFNWLAVTQGVKVNEKGQATVKQTEIVSVEEAGALNIKDKAVTDAVVIGNDGANHKATFASGAATVETLTKEVGKNVTVSYEKEVTGNTISIRADRFAEKYQAQLRTVAYDKDTEAIVKDVFIIFENVTPSSEFSMSLEAGSAMAPEIKLRAAADPKTKAIGTFVLVDFVEGNEGL